MQPAEFQTTQPLETDGGPGRELVTLTLSLAALTSVPHQSLMARWVMRLYGAARRGLEVLTPDQTYVIEWPCNRSIRRTSESCRAASLIES